MSKLKIILLLLALIAVFYFTTDFCAKKTDEFSITFIRSDLNYNPEWQIQPISLKAQAELEKIFSQKFYYLGCGGQSFAFVSENQEYVIKFFKHRYFRKPFRFIFSLPRPSVLELSRLRKYDNALFKLRRDFSSYKLAYEELREESGLVYIHLNKGTELNRSVHIIDKIGIEHEIDLDDFEFIVQRRAELIYPCIDALMAKEDVEAAKQLLHSILEAIVNRCKKGIFDEDPRIHNNLGIIGPKAMFIDIGRFVKDSQRTLPEIYKNDLKNIINERLRSWLQNNHPQLEACLDDEIAQLN